MDITIIAVGNKMLDWVNEGFSDYATRFNAEINMQLKEIPLQKRGDDKQIAAARSKESAQILAALAGKDYVVTLDIAGKNYRSEQLAARLQFWQENARSLALIIGGPEGLSAEVKSRAQESWSLGALTLPHPLVRIIVAEALYRAWSINHHHPYHRA